MSSHLLQRSALRAALTWLPSRTGAAAAAAQRAALIRVALDARRTFLTSPLSLAASKLTETSATGAKKSASKSTATETEVSKPKKLSTTMETKKKAAKVGRPKKAAKVGRPKKAAKVGRPRKAAKVGRPRKVAKVGRPKKVANVGRPKKTAAKVGRPKKSKQPLKRLTASELPPKNAAGPWNIFLAKHLLGSRLGASTGVEAREMQRQFFQQASAAWRRLSDAEKKPYYEQYEAAKAESAKRRAEYFTTAPDELITRLNIARKQKGKSTIKRRHTAYKTGHVGPGNSYNFFIRDYFRNNHRDKSVHQHDFMRQAAAVWKGISESERAPFAELARKDKERYRQEIGASG